MADHSEADLVGFGRYRLYHLSAKVLIHFDCVDAFLQQLSGQGRCFRRASYIGYGRITAACIREGESGRIASGIYDIASREDARPPHLTVFLRSSSSQNPISLIPQIDYGRNSVRQK